METLARENRAKCAFQQKLLAERCAEINAVASSGRSPGDDDPDAEEAGRTPTVMCARSPLAGAGSSSGSVIGGGGGGVSSGSARLRRQRADALTQIQGLVQAVLEDNARLGQELDAAQRKLVEVAELRENG